jgi:hypothetical protein
MNLRQKTRQFIFESPRVVYRQNRLSSRQLFSEATERAEECFARPAILWPHVLRLVVWPPLQRISSCRPVIQLPSTATLKKQILHKRVMVTGWLFYDSMHEGNAANTNPRQTNLALDL